MIAFYISSHGYGHTTRCLAIIEQILRTTKLKVYICSDEKQTQFAKLYLESYLYRVDFSVRKTDVGIVYFENTLKVNKEELENSLKEFVEEMDVATAQEVEILKHHHNHISLVITDISILGIYVAKALGVKVIGISNYTWYDNYKHLGIDEKITQFFFDAYQNLDYYLEYEFSLDNSYLKCEIEKVGVISRALDQTKVKRLKNCNPNSAYISCGQSASLKNINIDFKNGTIFYTPGMNIASKESTLLLINNIKDTQNYLASSSMALIKPGWGTVAEALISQVPLVVIENVDVLEENIIIEKLKERGLCLSISREQLESVNLHELLEQTKNLKVGNYENNVANVVMILLKHAHDIRGFSHEKYALREKEAK